MPPNISLIYIYISLDIIPGYIVVVVDGVDVADIVDAVDVVDVVDAVDS